MRNRIKNFLADQSGATAIEYGLIAGLVSIVIIASLKIFAGSLNATFTSVAITLTK